MIRFSIDSASPVPVHHQVKQSLVLEMLSGRLKQGDRLPPIRELAKVLKLNPNTVSKVYYNLTEEGFIQGRAGSGYTVKGQKAKLDQLKVSMIEGEFRSFLEKAFLLGFSRKDIENLMRRIMNHD